MQDYPGEKAPGRALLDATLHRGIARTRDWVGRDDTKVLLALLSFVAFIRVLLLGMPSNHDATRKWGFVRQVLNGESILASLYDHHCARWGINGPIALVQALFGDAATMYYLPILTFDLLLAYFTYKIGIVLGGRRIGVLTAVVITLMPKMEYLGSQLMPSVFESVYVLAAVYAALLSTQCGARRYLAVSLLAMLLAYLSKETCAFFMPGLVLAIWRLHSRLWYAAVYSVGFLSGIALETWIYRGVFDFEWGRMTIIRRHHLGNPKMAEPIDSVWTLLDQYTELSVVFSELFFLGFLATVVILLWPRDKSWPERWALLAVAAPCWSFFLLSTFAVQSLSPPRLVQPLNERYLISALPLLGVIAFAVLFRVVRVRCAEGFKGSAMQRYGILFGVIAAYISLVNADRFDRHPFRQISRVQSMLRTAFDNGTPIVAREEKRYAANATSQLFLTRAQHRRVKFAYPRLDGDKARVIVNRSHPRFRGKSKVALNKQFRGKIEGPTVEVWMKGGFHAELRK